MHGEHKNVVLRISGQQRDTQHRTTLYVKGALIGLRRLLDAFFPRAVGRAYLFKGKGELIVNVLHRNAFVARQGRPQGGMAVDEHLQRTA